MADPAQIRILRKGVKAWNKWRKANPHIQMDLSNADLRRAKLHGADLNGATLRLAKLYRADLSGAYLRGADLRVAQLGEADLRDADCCWAQLRKADLSKANLSNAYLGTADLRSANLGGAKLCGTYLDEADLGKADLGGANLVGATVGYTNFGNVDLSKTVGLKTIRHRGPSTIGIDTIYRSAGNIPEIFLRGAGVPEPFIVQMKSLVDAMSPIEFYSCFISYSHNDKAFARQLHDSLQARGIRCWLDEHQLLPGDDIYHEVDRGIRLWDKMLLCCSEHSLTSWWVDNEIGTAFEKEQQIMKERGAKAQVLVPLNLDGYLFSDKCNSKHGYQAQIRRRLAADFTQIGTDSTKFDAEVERLIRALRADEGAREKPPKGKL